MLSTTGAHLPITDDDITALRIGVRVRVVREEMGWSVSEVAERAGTAPETVTAVEDGTRLPTLSGLYRLAAALHVETGELLPGAWERPRIDLHLPITTDAGSSTAQVIGGGPGNPTQTFLFELRAGEGDGGFGTHPGTELLIVTDGEVVVSELGRPDVVVTAGRSHVMNTRTHHAIRGGGSGVSRLLLICTGTDTA